MFSFDSTSRDATTSLPPAGSSLLEALRACGIRAYFSADCGDDRLLAAAGQGLAAIAELIDLQPRCRAQLSFLSRQEIDALRHRDTWVLAPYPRGWLVRSESAVVSSFNGQPGAQSRKGPKALNELPERGAIEVVVVEVDAGLQAIGVPRGALPQVWTRLWSLLKLERREISSLLVYSILLGALSLALPTAVQVMVNSIAMAQLIQPLVVLSIFLLTVLLLEGVTKLLRAYTAEILARRVFARVAEDFCARLPQLHRGTQDRFDLSERSQRFFETITLQKTIEVLAVDGLGLLISTAAGLALLTLYHPLLFLFGLALIAGFGIIAWSGKGAFASANDESGSKYRVAAWIRELSVHADSFRSPCGQRLARQRGDYLVSGYLRARKLHFRKLFRQLFSGVVLYALAMVLLLGLGGYLVMQGELSLGQLVAAELVVGIVVKGFTKIGKHLEKLYDLHAGLEKIGMVVDLPRRPVHRATPRPKQITLAKQKLNLQGAHLEKTLLFPGRRYLIQSASPHALMELRSALMGYRTQDTQSSLQAISIDQSGHEERLCADHFAGWTVALEADEWSEVSILEYLRVGNAAMQESEALRILDGLGIGEWIRTLPNTIHTRMIVARSESTPWRKACLELARAQIACAPIVILGSWLDSKLIRDDQRKALLEQLEHRLPSSIILEFACAHSPPPEQAILIRPLSFEGR